MEGEGMRMKVGWRMKRGEAINDGNMYKSKITCNSSKNYWYIIMIENESEIIMKFSRI